MSIKVLAGELYNILSVGDVTVSSESALFPKANAYDGRPDSAFQFSAPGTFDSISVDGNKIRNGALDTWAVSSQPDNWTATGTVAQSTTIARSGSAAAINGPSSVAISTIYQDFRARSGERIVAETYVALSVAATAPFAVSPILTLQNLFTGNYATSSGGWSSNLSVWATPSNSTSFVSTGQFAIAVESFEDTGQDVCTLRLTHAVSGATSGVAYIDDSFVWSAVDFASVHGHNIRGDVLALLQSSVDNFASASTTSTVQRAILVKAQPSFYTALTSPVDERYWKLRFTYSPGSTLLGAAPTEAIYLGEAVIGQATELTRPQDLGQEIRLVADNIRVSTPYGATWSHRVGRQPRRVLGMGFSYFTSSEYQEARQEVFERSFGSANPIVIVPDTDHADVIHGRISDEFSVRNTLQGQYDDGDLIVVEDSFPVWTE